jgi:tripeptidyl-peptidase-1
MKLSLQGVSVIVASGNAGVANKYNSDHDNVSINTEFGHTEIE